MRSRPVRLGLAAAVVLTLALGGLGAPAPGAAQTINHSFNQTMLKFAELVQTYYGKPVEFKLHRNRELGLEKDYFGYMTRAHR